MATVLENLQTSKINLAAWLADITADPKPNYSIDGKSVSWQSLFDSITARMEAINKLIALEEGPAFELTQVVT